MDSATRESTAKATARKPVLMRLGIGVFAIGILCVLAVFALFAAGLENLPVALSAAAGVLTPLGLGLGLISLVLQARRDAATSAAGANAAGANGADAASPAKNGAAES